MKGKPTNGRGGHRQADLASALTLRQQAMSRRTAGKINAILSTHIRRDAWARIWVRHVDRARARLLAVPDTLRGPGFDEPARAVLRVEIEGVLGDNLVVTDEQRALAARPPEEPERRAVVKPVRTLAEARAQGARLQARLIDLRARVVRDVDENRNAASTYEEE